MLGQQAWAMLPVRIDLDAVFRVKPTSDDATSDVMDRGDRRAQDRGIADAEREPELVHAAVMRRDTAVAEVLTEPVDVRWRKVRCPVANLHPVRLSIAAA